MNVLTFTGLEIRTLVRSTRAWIVVSAINAVGLLVYWAYTVVPYSPASVEPRFLVGAVGGLGLGVACLGVVFLCLDNRARDERQQIADSLDARPYSNVDLVVGRSLGVATVAWVAVAAMCACIEILDVLTRPPSGAVFGIEPVSLAAFLLVSAPEKLVFWSAFVTFLAAAIRIRILVAVVAIGLLCVTHFLLFQTPYYLLSPIFGAVHLGHLASDVLPEFVSGTDAFHVLCATTGSISLFALAAAAHPRLDRPSIRSRLLFGTGLAIVGTAGIGLLVDRATDHMRQRDSWTTTHEAWNDLTNVDIERLEGRVEIIPDSHMTIDLDLQVSATADSNSIVFALNPGLVIQDVQVDGRHVQHDHIAGLLGIALDQDLTSGRELLVSISAAGSPDVDFGYFDSAVDFRTKSLTDSRLHLLGTRNSIFDARFVALMPTTDWLPTPHSGTPGSDDFFTIDLIVSVPPDWTVVGPGRRERIAGDNETATYRFRPTDFFSDVVIVAAPFVRRARTFGDYEVELLAHPKHLDSLLRYSDVVDKYDFNIELLLSALSRYAISDNQRGMSLVEVPGSLRIYGGGREMESVQSFPGITLLRELDLPIRVQDELNPSEAARLRPIRLMSYIDMNRAGGNPVYGSATSLLRFQIPGSGTEAHVIRLVINDIVNRVVQIWASLPNGPNGFSAHMLVDSGERWPGLLRDPAASVAKVMGLPPASSSRSTTILNLLIGDPTLSSDLGDCPEEVLRAQSLKSRAAASLIVDSIGLEEAGRLIGGMAERNTGGELTWLGFVGALPDVPNDVQLALENWMSRTSLPAFSASTANFLRLPDADGKPRYQTRAHIRNDGLSSGFVKLQIVPQQYDPLKSTTTIPVSVQAGKAVEIGLVYPYPTESAMIVPYLSHNRGPIPLHTREFSQKEHVPMQALEGHQESDWEPAWKQWVVVDDLDDGFQVIDDEVTRESSPCSWLARDAGLPSFGHTRTPTGDWSREEVSSAWGKHRTTIVRSLGNQGRRRIAFSAHLPDAGVWRLEYHMPDDTWRKHAWRKTLVAQHVYRMELAFENGSQFDIDFNASTAEPGWNRLGEYEVQSGKAVLKVSNRANDRVVAADAIRWQRAN